MKHLPVYLLLLFASAISAQDRKSDSAAVAKRLVELLGLCKNVDFSDPEVGKKGTFYNAAPYIVYRGEDEKRKWKDIANYSNAEEKKQVDNICYRINNSVNQDPEYRITKYHTETESEGTWHILFVTYTRKGEVKEAAFAFLLLKGQYALGDID